MLHLLCFSYIGKIRKCLILESKGKKYLKNNSFFFKYIYLGVIKEGEKNIKEKKGKMLKGFSP